MYTKIIHNDDSRKYFLKNQQIISDSLGNGRECRSLYDELSMSWINDVIAIAFQNLVY